VKSENARKTGVFASRHLKMIRSNTKRFPNLPRDDAKTPIFQALDPLYKYLSRDLLDGQQFRVHPDFPNLNRGAIRSPDDDLLGSLPTGFFELIEVDHLWRKDVL